MSKNDKIAKQIQTASVTFVRCLNLLPHWDPRCRVAEFSAFSGITHQANVKMAFLSSIRKKNMKIWLPLSTQLLEKNFPTPHRHRS